MSATIKIAEDNIAHQKANKANAETFSLRKKKRVKHEIVTVFEDDGTYESKVPR